MKVVICPPKRDKKIPVFDYWQTKYDPFRLDTDSKEKTSFFEAIFVLNSIQYRYGFELNAERITSEWLYRKEKREVEVLSRNENLKTHVNQKYISTKIAENITSAEMISETVPFLSVLSTFSDPLCKSIVDWFESIAVISANDIRAITPLTDSDKASTIVGFLKAFDFNIEGLSLHEISFDDIPEKIRAIIDVKEPKGAFYDGINTTHIVYDNLYERDSTTLFSLESDESFGTNRLFHLSWPIISAIRNGHTIMIDEIDSGIHPSIVKTIINIFTHCCSTAQLIFNTHNASLLNSKDDDDLLLLRKDQIYLVNKNRYGEAMVKPATDFESDLRSNIEKMYLEGKITGTPYVDTDALLKIMEK
jgi:AAA15 family ATPase/GTPase